MNTTRFDKIILPNYFIFNFWSNIILTGAGPMFLAFSILEIISGSFLTFSLTKVFKKRILDLIGRGCIYFNVTEVIATNYLISFLSYLSFNIFSHHWPRGMQSLSRIHYEFSKILHKMSFFFDFITKDKVFLSTLFVFVFDFQYLELPVTLW